MALNINFQLAGLILLVMIIIMFARRPVINLPSFKVFNSLLIGVFLSVCLDIASVFALVYRKEISTPMTLSVCKVYLASVAVVAFLILRYVMIQNANRRLLSKVVFGVSFVVLCVYMFAIIFLPVDYYVDNQTLYSYGLGVSATYVVALLMLLTSLIYTIKMWSFLKKNKRKSVIFMLSALFLASFIQMFNNQILLVSFAQSVAIVYIYMCLENPDDYIDKVSGVFNMNAARLLLGQEYENDKRLNIITIEIGGIKFINDTFGTKNGTMLLCSVAEFLEDIPGVSVYRTGGAEYSIALFGEMDEFKVVEERIRRRFEYAWTISEIETLLPVKICIFPATLVEVPIEERFELLRYFVNLMSGSNSEEKFIITEDIIKEKRKEENIEKALNIALDLNTVMVNYQPIYNNKKGYYTSAEALMRIRGEDGNFIPPDLFINIAEKKGLILKLGMVMFENVCRFIKENKLQETQLEYIEVNLSVIQCMQQNLAEQLIEVMDRYEIAHSFINFEITETAASNSESTLLVNMRRLINNGSTFSLDDYGSGYSNINYILELPIEIVKYDKLMVWSYFTSEKGRVVMEYAVDMMKNLNLKSLAEGVETKEQFEEIKRLGIDYTQGYFFSKPLNEEDFVKCIKGDLQTQVNLL